VNPGDVRVKTCVLAMLWTPVVAGLGVVEPGRGCVCETNPVDRRRWPL
jgi:hypothetical protein